MIDNKEMYKLPKGSSVVMLQSGGLDSCYLACLFNRMGFNVHHLFVDYGQNSAKKELEYAKKIVKEYGGELHTASIKLPWLSESSVLVGNHKVVDKNVSYYMGTVEAKTYVPLRNHVLMSMAGSLAESLQIPYLALAVEGSQNIFGKPIGKCPDKHKRFLELLEKSISEGSSLKHTYGGNFQIIAPILGFTKEDTNSSGLFIGCDFSLSWSCYNQSDKPCGVCPACVDRANHFRALGVPDPLITPIDSKG